MKSCGFRSGYRSVPGGIGHLKSPHKFTQPQLMTCLVLRAYLKTTYRGVVDFLASSQELCDAIGLKSLPHYSTLKRFADRSAVAEIADAMFAEIIKECAPDAKEMAVDSTGIQDYRRQRLLSNPFGPKEHEIRQAFARGSLRKLVSLRPGGELGTTNGPRGSSRDLEKAMAKVRPKKLYADAGYDAEWVHAVCREHWNVESFIPPSVHRKDGSVGGHYRSQMVEMPKSYGRRWHIETFMSGLKRTTAAHCQPDCRKRCLPKQPSESSPTPCGSSAKRKVENVFKQSKMVPRCLDEFHRAKNPKSITNYLVVSIVA